MKLRQIALAAGLVSGFLASGQALAVNVCPSCQYTGGATYLGTLNPNQADIAQYNRTDLVNTGSSAISVTDYWLFSINPTGSWQITGSITPFGNPQFIQGLTVSLWNISSFTSAGSANSLGTSGAVSAFLLGTQVTPSTVSESNGTWAGLNTVLAAGDYAFQVTYNLAPATSIDTSSYNGNISTRRLPEPASLGLVGVALLGAAVGLRRGRKQAA